MKGTRANGARATRRSRLLVRRLTAVGGALLFLMAGALPAAAEDPLDTVAPTATVTLTAVQGGDSGFMKSGTVYLVCAKDVVDGGEVPSGIASITADVSGITPNKTAEPLVTYGQWCLTDNTSYPYSFEYHVGSPFGIPNGPRAYSVTLTDNAGNVNTISASVMIDNVKPTGVDIQTANKAGGVAGKPELGDTLTYTFSEPMNFGAANYAPYLGVVHIDNSSSNDVLTFWNGLDNQQQGPGSIKLGGNFVSSNRKFGKTGTRSSILRVGNTLVLTLGTPDGSVNTVSSSTRLAWTVASAGDRACNGVVTGTKNELGSNDKDF